LPPMRSTWMMFAVIATLLAAACSSSSPTSTALPACTWPAALDPPDVSTTACVAARTYLSCKLPNGGGEDCLSNDPTRCSGGIAGPTCTDLCNANEYAVACGGPGPAQPPPLPSGCRSLLAGPGGGISGCCPCGA
jgi:hypothetical protein